MNHLISIGILVYNNTIKEITRCLTSIKHQTYGTENVEIIIRNQGNPNLLNDIQNIAHQIDLNIKLHQGDNLGFGKGHNQIFTHISPQSKAYLCMNPDGFMHDEALENLVHFAEKIDWKGIVEAIQEPIMHPKYFNPKSGLTEWCFGACVLIPNSIYSQINGFDDDFFLYCEDIDLSWRVRASGFSCYTCTNAYFFHYAMDRQSREVEIWKSASYLAYKWRSNSFFNTSLAIWMSHTDMKKSELKKELNQLKQHSIAEVQKVNPNFKKGLYFAQNMWG